MTQRDRLGRTAAGHGGNGDVVDALVRRVVVVGPAHRHPQRIHLVAGDEQLIDRGEGRAALRRQHHAQQRAAIRLLQRDRGVDGRPAAQVGVAGADELLRDQPAAAPHGDVVAGAVAAIIVVGVEADGQRVGEPGIGEQVGADAAVAPGVRVQERHREARGTVAALLVDREVQVDRDLLQWAVAGHGEVDGVVLVVVARTRQLQGITGRARQSVAAGPSKLPSV